MLHFIVYFSYELGFSMNFVIMTSARYYDVTHFWQIPMKFAQHNYVKLEIKDILFMRIFWFSEYLLRKLRFITKITSMVQLPCTSPPISFGWQTYCLWEFFDFRNIFGIFIEKIAIYYENYIYGAVTLHLSPHLLWVTH